MKLKDGFTLKEISGQNVVVYTGKDANGFNASITLNETSAFLWHLLEKETTKEKMLYELLGNYEMSTVLALNDIDVFIRTLNEHGIIEN